MENGEVYKSYEEIEHLYKGKLIPVLSKAAQQAIREFLLENGCENIGGIVLFDNAPEVHEARSMIEWQFQDNKQKTFVGPHFLGDQYEIYSPHGVGLYTRGNQG